MQEDEERDSKQTLCLNMVYMIYLFPRSLEE